MKQIWPDYSYSPATNVLTLTGLNIDRDQLLLVTAADRGRIMYNFADSSVTASAFTSGANTALTLVATTAGLTTTAALVIYFDDQATSSTVTGTVELGPTSLNALESITVTMGQVTVTGGLTDVQLRASAVTVGGTVTVGNFPASQAVTFGAVTGSVSVLNFPASQAVTFSAVSIQNFPATQPVSIASVTIGNSVTIGSLPAISGTVTANLDANSPIIASQVETGIASYAEDLANAPFPISGTVTVGNSVTIGSLPAISGTVTANTFALQGTAVTTSNFTSTTASTLLASFNATREVLTIFNEGAGLLFVCPGATCTTVQYQVRLSSGDYYEVPNHQTTITHSAVFATAGTARVTQVS
jgi:hypothetical protein